MPRPPSRPIFVLLVAAATTPLAAQSPDTTGGPTTSVRAARSRSGVRAEWLQAGAGPIHRRALPSLALGVERVVRRGPLAGAVAELGWLRAARPTTTAQGVAAGLSWPLSAGRLTLRPGFALLGGQAIATADSGGYDWRGIAPPYLGQTGYQDRPRLTRGGTVGAGLQLGADVALLRGLRLTGSVRQWTFSGDVVRANRSPFLAGFGIGVDAGRATRRTRAAAPVAVKSVAAQSAAAQPDTAR